MCYLIGNEYCFDVVILVPKLTYKYNQIDTFDWQNIVLYSERFQNEIA